jgi:hypothetical protein
MHRNPLGFVLLERNEPRRVRRTDTWSAVLHRLAVIQLAVSPLVQQSVVTYYVMENSPR